MTNRIFAASYERGLELIASGCPIDYPDALARCSAARRTMFRAEQLAGVCRESRILCTLNPMQTNYSLACVSGPIAHAGPSSPTGV